MRKLENLNIKIFADGANFENIIKLNSNPLIKGFTTNPTLMKKEGISNYEYFAKKILNIIKIKPISFEVFADEYNEIYKQAQEISSWGSNVNVKIPITYTNGESTFELVRSLSQIGVICNITAIFTIEKLKKILEAIDSKTPAILSVFAGRVADTGVDPVPIIKEAVNLARSKPKVEILWASPREILNIFQAEDSGCHIITVAHEILDKLKIINKNLEDFSLETVSMFHKDAKNAGYKIDTKNKK